MRYFTFCRNWFFLYCSTGWGFFFQNVTWELPCNPIRNLLYFSNFRQAETWRRFRGNASQKHKKICIYVQVENIRYLCIKSVNIFMLCKEEYLADKLIKSPARAFLLCDRAFNSLCWHIIRMRKEPVNALPNVVCFRRVLRFPPTRNVESVGWD